MAKGKKGKKDSKSPPPPPEYKNPGVEIRVEMPQEPLPEVKGTKERRRKSG